MEQSPLAEEDGHYYSNMTFPLISKDSQANEIIEEILKNEYAVIGVDTEAALEMSRFGILCLLQVTHNKFYKT